MLITVQTVTSPTTKSITSIPHHTLKQIFVFLSIQLVEILNLLEWGRYDGVGGMIRVMSVIMTFQVAYIIPPLWVVFSHKLS